MIDKLQAEILKHGVVACLPCNMSDELLTCMADEVEQMKGGDELHTSCAIYGLLILLSNISGEIKVQIPGDELFDKMHDYGMEITLERISRLSNILYDAATLDTIFTKRDVKFWY